MIYLLLGEDRAAKEEKIAAIKTQILTPKAAFQLDYELLHSIKLDPATLKKALIALPAIADKRLVFIRAVDKLNTQNKNILLDFIQEQQTHIVLVLDSNDPNPRNSFFNKVQSFAKVLRFGQKAVLQNVFDMAREIEGRNPTGALKTLGQLFENGDPPLKVMGGLVWSWGKLKNRLPAEKFKKGLLVLQEADLNIKRSRLKPEYSIEIAVTKLCSLTAC